MMEMAVMQVMFGSMKRMMPVILMNGSRLDKLVVYLVIVLLSRQVVGGTRIAIEAYRNDGNGIDAGRVRIYDNDYGPSSTAYSKLPGTAYVSIAVIGTFNFAVTN